MRRRLSSLSHENLLALEEASAATGIRASLLVECVLAGDYAVLTRAQEERLLAYIEQWRVHQQAEEVFERVMAAPGLDLLRLFGGTAE